MRSLILGVLGGLLASTGSALADTYPRPRVPDGHSAPWHDGYRHDSCNTCPHYPRPQPRDYDETCGVWIGVEGLVWWTKKQPNTFPLVTTTANGLLGGADEGRFSDPNTVVLIGNEGFEVGELFGGRVNAGLRLGHRCSLDLSGFWLPEQSSRQEFSSDATGFPGIVRPFIDTDTNQELRLAASLPGLARGTAFVEARTELWGGEANLLVCLGGSHGIQWSLIGGMRYLSLEESLRIGSTLTTIAPTAIPFNGVIFNTPGDSLSVIDDFRTQNQIYGGTVGIRAAKSLGALTFGVQAKLTLGNNHQTFDIRGLSTITPAAGIAQSSPIGLLAVPSNSGKHESDEFVLMPEVNVRLQYDLTDCCYVYVGYDLLYINKVVRPEDGMSPFVSFTQSPLAFPFPPPTIGNQPPPPDFTRTSDFWGQGVNFGIGFRF